MRHAGKKSSALCLVYTTMKYECGSMSEPELRAVVKFLLVNFLAEYYMASWDWVTLHNFRRQRGILHQRFHNTYILCNCISSIYILRRYLYVFSQVFVLEMFCILQIATIHFKYLLRYQFYDQVRMYVLKFFRRP